MRQTLPTSLSPRAPSLPPAQWSPDPESPDQNIQRLIFPDVQLCRDPAICRSTLNSIEKSKHWIIIPDKIYYMQLHARQFCIIYFHARVALSIFGKRWLKLQRQVTKPRKGKPPQCSVPRRLELIKEREPPQQAARGGGWRSRWSSRGPPARAAALQPPCATPATAPPACTPEQAAAELKTHLDHFVMYCTFDPAFVITSSFAFAAASQLLN